MKKASAPSNETRQEAMKIARATQKPGQNKEQTKLIAQGIEKGIAVYKKQQKEKQRQADKERKRKNKEKQQENILPEEIPSAPPQPEKHTMIHLLPWILTAVSWGILLYIWIHPAV
ncbi:DUF2956 family protein [Vibrio quintilis]|uniref:DUF2956 domain-containing protein n=1 Tax=Vibrio quintilis TaxID=1117707 RepID=A0A1M7YTE6_9VIBR|nr:DUF2956 family protein [Vibrio quintilis]SHO55841.1 hypothetical protein VQ7734_01602 [Vibrio quintilis]